MKELNVAHRCFGRDHKFMRVTVLDHDDCNIVMHCGHGFRHKEFVKDGGIEVSDNSIAISQGPIDLDFDRPSTHWRDTIGLQGKCIDRHILDFGEFQSSWIEHNVQLTYHVHSQDGLV